MIEEVWVVVENFNDYEVSNFGNVRSWKARNGRSRALTPRALNALPFVDSDYLRVTLYCCKKPQIKRVHRLVLEAFVGECPIGLEGCHNDGNAKNNMLSNLRWGTKCENAKDRIDHGKQVRGETVAIAVLTDEQASEIRKHVLSGLWQRGDGRKFSKKFGVGDSAISSVKHNQTWNHI